MAKEEAEIKELSKKLAQNPDSMVFVQLADAYRRAGDLEKSVEVCLQGLERHPTYTTARAMLGRNYVDLGRLDEAEAEFRQIEVADPENIVAHRMLGQIYLDKGRFAEAVVRQQRVLALDPDDATAQELLQEALARAKQAEQAPAAPAQAPQAEAQIPVAAKEGSAAKAADAQSGTLKVAEIYIKKGALDEAAEVLQEILAADPGHAVAQQRLQEVNAKRGHHPEAKAKAEAEAKAKAEAEARAKAEAEAAEAAAKAAEAEAAAQREKEAQERKAAKLSSEDILSVMAGGADDLIEEPAPSAKAPEAPAKPAADTPAGLPADVQKIIDDFVKAQAIEACLVLDPKGGLLDSRHAGQAGSLGQTAAAIFSNTEKAAVRMHFGGLKQIMVVGEDGRQILFVALKAGVLVALTGKQTNLGLLRVAVNDLVKRA